MPDTKKIAKMGMIVAVAFVLSYIETLLPLNLGVPGIKAGLSNIVVVFSIYYFNRRMAFGIAITRILLCGMAFGSMSGMFYSLAGGVFHNIGQLLVAIAVLQNKMAAYYLPFLLIAGVTAGVAVGILAAILIRRFKDTGIF